MKALLELAGAASHELNQPLQIYAEIILHEREGMLEERRRGIEEIQEQVKCMSRILWNLTHLTRYETREYTGDMNIIYLDKFSERGQQKPEHEEAAHPAQGLFRIFFHVRSSEP